LTGLNVAVVGTALNTAVDATGRFTLTGVPAGDVQLHFTGGGVDAVVPVGSVQPAQTITIVVTLTGAGGQVESEVRDGAGEQELEGRVEALPPTVPSGTLRVAGRTVTTDGSTRIRQADVARSFADLQINQRVHVRGHASGADLLASLIEIQSTNTAVPVEVNGIVDTLTGNASSFQFKIGSRVVKGDGTTQFFGDGNRGTTFSALANGARVEVKGEQRDGFVFATRIHVEDQAEEPNDDHGNDNHDQGDDHGGGNNGGGHDDNGGHEAEVEASGALGGLQGSCPALSFRLGTFNVTTNASTMFDGISCSALKNGDAVEMKGTRQSNGSVLATRMKKQ
jgi:hypothetical protein